MRKKIAQAIILAAAFSAMTGVAAVNGSAFDDVEEVAETTGTPYAGFNYCASSNMDLIASGDYEVTETTTQTTAIAAAVADAYAEDASAANICDSYVTAAAESGAYENIGIATVSDYVNVRAEADADSEEVGKLYSNNAAIVMDETEDFYYVSSGSFTGYVSKDYLTVGNEGVITAAETDDTFTYGESAEEEEARIAEEEKAAEEAAAEEAAKAAANSSTKTYANDAATSYTAASGSDGSSVYSFASQFVGCPYKAGGTSLTNGSDCSGFVRAVYAQYGVSLPHSSSAMRSVGTGVSTSDVQVGDILCYSGHVGIYAGNGQMLSALNSRAGITYIDMNYKDILAVRRIFN